MRVPVATYRLQLNASVGFANARQLAPYLDSLGISDLYISPVLRARKGSPHCYDITDPTCVNPELGGYDQLVALSREVAQRQMGLLLDVVPNHMAMSADNPWWMDVLEKGRCSPYSKYFDIRWESDGGKGKIMLPVLGRPYRDVLEDQELSLSVAEGRLVLRYHEQVMPVSLRSHLLVLRQHASLLEERLGTDHPSLDRLRRLIAELSRVTDLEQLSSGEPADWCREYADASKDLADLFQRSDDMEPSLRDTVLSFNGSEGDPRSFDNLERLIREQVYELTFWRTGRNEVNYRRFFDINDLIGLRVEDREVVDASHALVFQLARDGIVTGLRIDHIDGVLDPLAYLRALQRRLRNKGPRRSGRTNFYIVTEKILSGNEALPHEWPVSGTTGYDFLKVLNGVFVDPAGLRKLGGVYGRFTSSGVAFQDIVYSRKKQVVEDLFAADLRSLVREILKIARSAASPLELRHEDVALAIKAVTAGLPVYRTYIRGQHVAARDWSYVDHALDKARRREPDLDGRTLDFLRSVLLLGYPPGATGRQKKAMLRFVMRWQQFTGPVMAKGFEDTSLYCYSRLVSLNEVGGDPEGSQAPVETFHRFNLERREYWPYSMNASATHDTKRSEDMRARINVLSERPALWEEHLARWSRWNAAAKTNIEGGVAPDADMELLIYQTLIGAWPLSDSELPAFKERLKAYVLKAAREAKLHTNWLSPDNRYEKAVMIFVEHILETAKSADFIWHFLDFQAQVAFYGFLNSLAQLVLKIASPGVPDFYQGTELWDLSMVDPDNRRAVDFQRRSGLLDEIIAAGRNLRSGLCQDLLSSWRDGRIKLYTTQRALYTRRRDSDLFLKGEYLPCEVHGRHGEHAVAFARQYRERWCLAVVPRLLSSLVTHGRPPLGPIWYGTSLQLPGGAPQAWENVFTGELVRALPNEYGMPLSEVFATFPAALLICSGD